MNGPEHYRAADNLLAELRQAQTSMSSALSREKAAHVVANAQAHATLALAAAFALTQPIAGEKHTDGYPSDDHYKDWYDAIEGGGK